MDPSNQSPLVVGHTYKMKITNVNSATNFGVQLMEREGIIDLIQDTCQRAAPEAAPIQAKDLHEGELCLARFDVDRNWYRAFIREVHEELGLATVYFADFGNLDDCDIKDLRECPLAVSKMFPQVIECQWVNANSSGTGIEKIISKLDDLLESETYVDGKIVHVMDNQGWLFNQAGGDGPVVVSIPELEGGDLQLQVEVNNANANKPATDTVGKVEAATGAKREAGKVGKEESAPMNGASAGLQDADGVDGGGPGHHVLTFKAAENDSTSGPGVLLATVDEFLRELGILRQQIVDLEKNPGPPVRKMTPAESTERVQECKAEGVQLDQKVNSLLELLSAKESNIQEADEGFTIETNQLKTAIRAKHEEVIKLRIQVKLLCA